jgi:1-acyl-sn-glycerol-3-phosphate acyltransferase
MARRSLFSNPAFGRLISSVNAFPVKRGTGDVGAVKEILRRLKAGKLVLVFPEATRTRDGSIGPINPNVIDIARKAKAAVVPAVIDGAFEAWPRTQWFPSPRPTHVTYAPPITVEEVLEESSEQIARTVAERMAASMEQSKRRRQRTHPHAWLR